jgi:TonB-dependent SusC/RagA subfamily outer membrane receptor
MKPTCNYSVNANTDKKITAFILLIHVSVLLFSQSADTVNVLDSLEVDSIDNDIKSIENRTINSIKNDEMINIGYGEKRKREVITAISSLKIDRIESSQYMDVADAMKGTIPGVMVMESGSLTDPDIMVQIRGIRSINCNQSPLWVVDGMIMHHVHTLGDLETVVSIHDIKSIEVLKDAASCAIYGSRGANGVILITTRSRE